jgi:hypothetical protein
MNSYLCTYTLSPKNIRSKRERSGQRKMTSELSEKLDILIKLQAAALTASFDSVKEKILFLHKAGLRPTLIADIVGTTPNHVNVTLSKERKPSKTNKKTKGAENE